MLLSQLNKLAENAGYKYERITVEGAPMYVYTKASLQDKEPKRISSVLAENTVAPKTAIINNRVYDGKPLEVVRATLRQQPEQILIDMCLVESMRCPYDHFDATLHLIDESISRLQRLREIIAPKDMPFIRAHKVELLQESGILNTDIREFNETIHELVESEEKKDDVSDKTTKKFC